MPCNLYQGASLNGKFFHMKRKPRQVYRRRDQIKSHAINLRTISRVGIKRMEGNKASASSMVGSGDADGEASFCWIERAKRSVARAVYALPPLRPLNQRLCDANASFRK